MIVFLALIATEEKRLLSLDYTLVTLYIIIIINAFLMHQIPLCYMCEARSAIHEQLQQFNNVLHLTLSLTLPHIHTHACVHTHNPATPCVPPLPFPSRPNNYQSASEDISQYKI